MHLLTCGSTSLPLNCINSSVGTGSVSSPDWVSEEWDWLVS